MTVLARMPDDAEKLRRELLDLAERRRVVVAAVEQLSRDTGRAIKRARGVLAMTEVAELIALDRTSLYRTYGA